MADGNTHAFTPEEPAAHDAVAALDLAFDAALKLAHDIYAARMVLESGRSASGETVAVCAGLRRVSSFVTAAATAQGLLPGGAQ